MNPDELLLRDIHLPEPVSWWPPALGWWLLLATTLIVIALVIFWWRRRVAMRAAPATLARVELQRLQATWATNHDTVWLVGEVAIWLRRAGMSLVSRHRAASLTGGEWQRFLNQLAGEQIFTAADIELLTVTRYRPVAAAATAERGAADATADGERLLQLCQHWLAAATRRGRPR